MLFNVMTTPMTLLLYCKKTFSGLCCAQPATAPTAAAADADAATAADQPQAVAAESPAAVAAGIGFADASTAPRSLCQRRLQVRKFRLAGCIVKSEDFSDEKVGHGTYIRWRLRTCCARMTENRSFRRKNIRFVTALDPIKYLEHIK